MIEDNLGSLMRRLEDLDENVALLGPASREGSPKKHVVLEPLAETTRVHAFGEDFPNVSAMNVQADAISEEDTQLTQPPDPDRSQQFCNEITYERYARELADTELRNLIEENQQTILRFVKSLELETAALRSSVSCITDDRTTNIAALTARYEEMERDLQRDLLGHDNCIRELDRRLAMVEQRVSASGEIAMPEQPSDLQNRLDALEHQFSQLAQWPSFESFKLDARSQSQRSETTTQKLFEFDEEVAKSVTGTPAKSPGRWISSPQIVAGTRASNSAVAPVPMTSYAVVPQVVPHLVTSPPQASQPSVLQPRQIRIPSRGPARGSNVAEGQTSLDASVVRRPSLGTIARGISVAEGKVGLDKVVVRRQSLGSARSSVAEGQTALDTTLIRMPSLGSSRFTNVAPTCLSAREVEGPPILLRSGSGAAPSSHHGPRQNLPTCSLQSLVTSPLSPVAANFGPLIGPLPAPIARQRSAPTSLQRVALSAATNRHRSDSPSLRPPSGQRPQSSSDSPPRLHSSGHGHISPTNFNDAADDLVNSLPLIPSLMPKSLRPQRREVSAQSPVTPVMAGRRSSREEG